MQIFPPKAAAFSEFLPLGKLKEKDVSLRWSLSCQKEKKKFLCFGPSREIAKYLVKPLLYPRIQCKF